MGKRLSQKFINILKAEYHAGKSPLEISNEHLISRNTIRNLIRRNGWATDRKARFNALHEIVAQEYAENLAKYQIEVRVRYANCFKSASERIRRLLESETDSYKVRSLVEGLQIARQNEFACYEIREVQAGGNATGNVIIQFSDSVSSWGVGVSHGTEV